MDKTTTALEKHFRDMQEACANYLEPTTYVARHPVDKGIGLCKWNTEFPMPDPTHAPNAVKSITDRRDQAFINDMIYMLDGPEQREAQASLEQVAEPVAWQIRCTLPLGQYGWKYPSSPGDLEAIRKTGRDESGTPYEIRPLYAAPLEQKDRK